MRLFLLALPFLLGICHPSSWSPPFALALIPLFLAKVQLSPTLTLSSSHDLVLWTDSSVPFSFGKGGSGVLAKCSLCGTEATLSFSAGLVCSRFSLKLAPFCTILAGLGSTNKSAVSLLFYYLTLVLFSSPCPLLHLSFYLKLCGRSGRNGLLSPPVLSGYNGSPGTRFSQETTRLRSWPDGERYLRPLQSPVVSLLLSLVSTRVFFSVWRRTVSSKFLDTQAPLISTEELVLPRHARCVFSRLRCNGHRLSVRFLSL